MSSLRLIHEYWLLQPAISSISRRGHGRKPRPAFDRARRRRSLRLVIVVGFPVELHLIADLDFGEERKREGNGDFQLALMGQFGDLPVDVLTKAAAGLLAEGYERFHEVDPPKWLCAIAKLEYGRNCQVHRVAVATERSGEENPLGLHARAGPAVSCVALRLRTATLEMPENAAFVAPAAFHPHQSANRQPAVRPVLRRLFAGVSECLAAAFDCRQR
ncbi:hypothetical protein F4V91_32015 [Neorhizobium galegae]|uniref:Uncharacterized protein n=1 Tax=Neorhizobium galegae TaxID=399 RepID=A0A6A1THZ8_NEOGA|nr:hypothetical protein F4V91_32015 [Neorhizobium galegae]